MDEGEISVWSAGRPAGRAIEQPLQVGPEHALPHAVTPRELDKVHPAGVPAPLVAALDGDLGPGRQQHAHGVEAKRICDFWYGERFGHEAISIR
jgi:hypothetical protein